MDVQCRFDWKSVGSIEVDDDGLRTPSLLTEPGIYLILYRHAGRERRYVGEAANLQRRFAHYRRPGPSQQTNLRMNDRCRRVSAAGGSIELHLAVDVQLVVDGRTLDADLGSEFVRRFVENAALIEVLATTGEVVNGKGYGELTLDEVLG
jgi:hypothetical protein